jgi:hypothetical protein
MEFAGVRNLGCTAANHLGSNPSSASAYEIRGDRKDRTEQVSPDRCEHTQHEDDGADRTEQHGSSIEQRGC